MRVGVLIGGLGLLATVLVAGPAGIAHAAADGCAAGVEADFNGDGHSDTVVGDPAATVAGQAGAGRLIVLYGDDAQVGEGLRDVLWQGEAEISGVPEAGDGFAGALALADLDCDSYTDVVVGTPGEDLGGLADVGMVQILYGGAGGLAISDASTNYTASNFGAVAAAGDQFGYAVDVVEDLGQGGTPAPDAYALAIGVPGADVSGQADAGALAVRAAYDGGSVTYWITQATPGIPGGPEAGDRFGAAVSCNYLSGDDDTVDCAVGIPNEDVGAVVDAGVVTVVTDIYFEDELTAVQLDQNAPGVPGSAEAGDFYGRAVDTVRVGGTSRIAVGAPGEDVGSDANAGLVQLFSSDTEDIDPGTALTQDTSGVGDAAQPGDTFGAALAFLAPGLGDTQTRLAVGVPKENTGSGADAGLVQVFRMSNLAADTIYTQASPGVVGAADAGDRFGTTLATVSGAGERVLLVGVPDDDQHAAGMVNVVPLSGGSHRAWIPGGAIPAAGASRFGATIGGVDGGTE